MNTDKLIQRLDHMQSSVNHLQSQMAILKKELEGSGAPESSARKGKTEQNIKKALDRRQKHRINKNKKAT